jgi:hypothetical protein
MPKSKKRISEKEFLNEFERRVIKIKNMKKIKSKENRTFADVITKLDKK